MLEGLIKHAQTNNTRPPTMLGQPKKVGGNGDAPLLRLLNFVFTLLLQADYNFHLFLKMRLQRAHQV